MYITEQTSRQIENVALRGGKTHNKGQGKVKTRCIGWENGGKTDEMGGRLTLRVDHKPTRSILMVATDDIIRQPEHSFLGRAIGKRDKVPLG